MFSARTLTSQNSNFELIIKRVLTMRIQGDALHIAGGTERIFQHPADAPVERFCPTIKFCEMNFVGPCSDHHEPGLQIGRDFHRSQSDSPPLDISFSDGGGRSLPDRKHIEPCRIGPGLQEGATAQGESGASTQQKDERATRDSKTTGPV